MQVLPKCDKNISAYFLLGHTIGILTVFTTFKFYKAVSVGLSRRNFYNWKQWFNENIDVNSRYAFLTLGFI